FCWRVLQYIIVRYAQTGTLRECFGHEENDAGGHIVDFKRRTGEMVSPAQEIEKELIQEEESEEEEKEEEEKNNENNIDNDDNDDDDNDNEESNANIENSNDDDNGDDAEEEEEIIEEEITQEATEKEEEKRDITRLLEMKEKIRYVDVCSLYSYVLKTDTFPLDQRFISENSVSELIGAAPNFNFDSVEGIIRYTVLPPRDLFYPVLPYRTKWQFRITRFNPKHIVLDRNNIIRNPGLSSIAKLYSLWGKFGQRINSFVDGESKEIAVPQNSDHSIPDGFMTKARDGNCTERHYGDTYGLSEKREGRKTYLIISPPNNAYAYRAYIKALNYEYVQYIRTIRYNLY
ncbi:hypothetical protein ALC56_02878, partial [Trachymyrmex septentrionalis]